MNIAYWASLLSMIFISCPLGRKTREFVISILIQNPLEFRVAMLSYQIKQLMLKYSNEGGTDNGSDGSGRVILG
jgi:hypothetical protein